jgi:hypothetical protein
MRRFRVVRGGVNDSHPAPTNSADLPADPAQARRLRALYAPPTDGYWDGLEATIMAAVRASRAAPAKTVEWWQTLARWARPGLAAAAVMIGVVGGVLVQTEGSRSGLHALRGEPSAIEPMDEDFARVIDTWGDSVSPSVRAEARAASDLLTDGVKRRGRVRLDIDAAASPTQDSAAHARADDDAKARREATFRYVMP